MKHKKIGFIGQGWIGKHYADNFEERGYEVIRYDITTKYKNNKTKLKECDIVFIAVPTPTINQVFDDSILIDAIINTYKNQLVVIKSTIQIGITEKIQKLFKDRYIFHSPEFLRERNAKFDVDYPERSIVGYTKKSKNKSQQVLDVMPPAPIKSIVKSEVAEMIKYAGNVFLTMKVLFANTVFDLCEDNKIKYNEVRALLGGDSRIGYSHLNINEGGRGAGGHCFIKDLSAYREMYDNINKDNDIISMGRELIYIMEDYNYYLLKNSKKDLDLLEGVYGK